MKRLDIISLNSVTEHSLKEPFAHCCGCCYESHSPVVWSVSASLTLLCQSLLTCNEIMQTASGNSFAVNDSFIPLFTPVRVSVYLIASVLFFVFISELLLLILLNIILFLCIAHRIFVIIQLLLKLLIFILNNIYIKYIVSLIFFIVLFFVVFIININIKYSYLNQSIFIVALITLNKYY